MKFDPASLLDEMERVFPAKRERRFQPLVNGVTVESLNTARDFKDKDDWTRLDPEWLDRTPYPLSSALSFLSDEAVCFYIPAFISADIGGRLKSVRPYFHLTHGFDNDSRNRKIHNDRPQTWGEYGARRWCSLTPDQVRAVVHYLEWHIWREGRFIAQEELQALENYWYPRGSES